VAKNSSVTQVTDFQGLRPLYHCITSSRCKEMVWYLVKNDATDDRSACPFSANELHAMVTAGFPGN
ncbi:ankyrin repeat protein, partial [Trifolium medium]|nr:ankyrin repeat protein [Trifolium medium]